MSEPTVDRKEFIRRYMVECNLNYEAASNVYECMVRTFEDGVANCRKITIGKLGALVPKWSPARTVVMSVGTTQKAYNMDGRYKYKFNVYKKWLQNHKLNWY